MADWGILSEVHNCSTVFGRLLHHCAPMHAPGYPWEGDLQGGSPGGGLRMSSDGQALPESEGKVKSLSRKE